MKRFVNGVEVELAESAAKVADVGDRLLVRTEQGCHSAAAVRSGEAILVSYRGRQFRIEKTPPRARGKGASGSGEIFAPMPGLIADVLVEQGQTVELGQTLLVLEAMKTHQPFLAPFAGIIEKLPTAKGEQVQEGDLLVVVRTVR